MHDRYWKQVMQFVAHEEWEKLSDYLDSYPWLSTAFMGTGVLPEYLATEKEYGLLRLLCNIEAVPESIIAKIISQGAKDSNGRAYLERLLAGVENMSPGHDRTATSGADSPLIAGMVLATTDDPVEVIERIQGVLEQGVQDGDGDRRTLAEKCIGRSQVFYDLQQLLYEHDRIDLLHACLGNRGVLLEMASGHLISLADVEKLLAGKS